MDHQADECRVGGRQIAREKEREEGKTQRKKMGRRRETRRERGRGVETEQEKGGGKIKERMISTVYFLNEVLV